MPIEIHEGGSITITGEKGMELMRWSSLLQALKLQKVGIRMSSRLPQATTIARKQFGLKGNLDSLIAQVDEIRLKIKNSVTYIETTTSAQETAETV
jgi:hypothetical protein